MAGEEDQDQFAMPDQAEVVATPTYLVDGSFGIATFAGIARVTFGAFKFNVAPGAAIPRPTPVVTLAISEDLLVNFAREIIKRAESAEGMIDDVT